MTTDELRDWHAREAGWEPFTDFDYRGGEKVPVPAWRKHEPACAIINRGSEYRVLWVHPFENTRDGAASAMPEGWTWMCQGTRWFAWPETNGGFVRAEVGVARTNDEIHDRYLLAKLAKEAMKNG